MRRIGDAAEMVPSNAPNAADEERRDHRLDVERCADGERDEAGGAGHERGLGTKDDATRACAERLAHEAHRRRPPRSQRAHVAAPDVAERQPGRGEPSPARKEAEAEPHRGEDHPRESRARQAVDDTERREQHERAPRPRAEAQRRRGERLVAGRHGGDVAARVRIAEPGREV
ncbi:MAG: hypothetical protein MUF21_09945, partial [Gemmatimonadaceae bacterium]|nr:hypothetical protein [Gemmatimonadaceae bacterium]